MSHQCVKAGVIGWPIDHSLSPRVHGFWLKTYGINGSYQAIPVEISALDSMLGNLFAEGFTGLNVTVPHKVTVMKYLNSVDELAQRIGAVNTIVVDEKGRLNGSNTDGFGFIENLKQGYAEFDAAKGPAVVLGAGGAARAVVMALIDEGAPLVKLINRTRRNAENLAENLGEGIEVIDWQNRNAGLKDAAVLINTTTLGMAGKDPLDISLDHLPNDALVNDIVYAPLETNLLKTGKARGNPTVDGLGMLLHQARPGFNAWFGVDPEVNAELRRHVLAGVGD